MTSRLLVIDRNTEPAEALQTELTREGFQADHARPGLYALRKALTDQPDLVILSVGPEEDDWNFCDQLLTFVERPLLLIVEASKELDCVRGLEIGADACLARPVRTVELLANVRALLRRRERQSSRSHHSFFVDKDLVIDLTRAEVRRNDKPIALTAMEFRILQIFTRHVDEVMSHERLAIQIWGANSPDVSAALKQYVYQLRQKLEPDPTCPQRIVTRRGQGYVFRSLTD